MPFFPLSSFAGAKPYLEGEPFSSGRTGEETASKKDLWSAITAPAMAYTMFGSPRSLVAGKRLSILPKTFVLVILLSQ